MSWMILLIASKMVLLALTYQYFSLTSLLSLQVKTEEYNIRSLTNFFHFDHSQNFDALHINQCIRYFCFIKISKF